MSFLSPHHSLAMPDESSSYFVYSGLHYSQCPVAVREQFAREFVNTEDFRRLKHKMEQSVGHAVEVVPISTCNRFDLCWVGTMSRRAIMDLFAESCAALRGKETDFLRIAFDDSAFQMLCRVAASLDSLVLGETHILGQLKQAYQTAVEGALCGSESAAIFTKCFQIAKRVRSETSLGHRSISIGHAAVDLARRVVNDLQNARILVVGAGEMGRLTAQHFLSCGAKDVTVTNRTFERAHQLASDLTVVAKPLDEALRQMAQFDIVVTATSAGEDVIRLENFKKLKAARRGHVTVFVDISVPRNVDPQIGKLDDVFVFNVDDLDKIMIENRAARSAAAADAERIISDELNLFSGVRRQRESLVQVGRFHAFVREMVKAEMEKNTRQGTRDLNIDVVANAVAKKLVTPVANMAKADVRVDGHVGAAVERIFQLSEKPHYDKN